jgi:hypothetical protein
MATTIFNCADVGVGSKGWGDGNLQMRTFGSDDLKGYNNGINSLLKEEIQPTSRNVK